MNERKAEPRKAGEDEPVVEKHPKGAPIGTHSFTGDGASVGMPQPSDDDEGEEGRDARRGRDAGPKDEPRGGGGTPKP